MSRIRSALEVGARNRMTPINPVARITPLFPYYPDGATEETQDSQAVAGTKTPYTCNLV